MADPTALDAAVLNFDEGSVVILNVILAVVMFGIALDLDLSSFRRQISRPKSLAVGLLAQLVLLPIMSFGLVLLLQPPPSVALGMIMIAACPGGNMSNFFTHHARGRTELSVLMTSAVTLGAAITTPFHVTFWGSLYEPSRTLLREIALDPTRLMITITMILAVPLALGMGVRARMPELAERLQRPLKTLSVGVFGLFVVGALAANHGPFLAHITEIFGLVALHNALALLLGYTTARAAGLEPDESRAVTIEVGIQNTGLGLALTFGFFGGLGGMAIVLAWWGVWHLLTGMGIATWWSRRPLSSSSAVSSATPAHPHPGCALPAGAPEAPHRDDARAERSSVG